MHCYVFFIAMLLFVASVTINELGHTVALISMFSATNTSEGDWNLQRVNFGKGCAV